MAQESLHTQASSSDHISVLDHICIPPAATDRGILSSNDKNHAVHDLPPSVNELLGAKLHTHLMPEEVTSLPLRPGAGHLPAPQDLLASLRAPFEERQAVSPPLIRTESTLESILPVKSIPRQLSGLTYQTIAPSAGECNPSAALLLDPSPDRKPHSTHQCTAHTPLTKTSCCTKKHKKSTSAIGRSKDRSSKSPMLRRKLKPSKIQPLGLSKTHKHRSEKSRRLNASKSGLGFQTAVIDPPTLPETFFDDDNDDDEDDDDDYDDATIDDNILYALSKQNQRPKKPSPPDSPASTLASKRALLSMKTSGRHPRPYSPSLPTPPPPSSTSSASSTSYSELSRHVHTLQFIVAPAFRRLGEPVSARSSEMQHRYCVSNLGKMCRDRRRREREERAGRVELVGEGIVELEEGMGMGPSGLRWAVVGGEGE